MKLTYKITVLCASFFFTSAALFAQESKGYEINGNIPGLKDGTKIVMNMIAYFPGHADNEPRDSAIVKNGQFHITGYVPDGPRMYWMYINGSEFVYRIYLDNQQHISLTLEKDIHKAGHQLVDRVLACTGSPSNDAFQLIRALTEGFDMTGSITHQLDKVKETGGYNKDVISALIAAKTGSEAALNKLYFNSLPPYMLPGAPLLSRYEFSHNLAWDGVYSQLDNHLRNSVDGKAIKDILPLLVGKEMPEFALPNIEGKAINLKDIISKSKVTVVRFWATNSYEWKAFDNELKAMYKLYHDKGLNIIAVSSDPYEEQWKETLSKENHPWLDVFDKKGEKFIDPVYHERGNPDKPNTTNVVLDSQGKIIAWDVAGVELQYHILKALGE